MMGDQGASGKGYIQLVGYDLYLYPGLTLSASAVVAAVDVC